MCKANTKSNSDEKYALDLYDKVLGIPSSRQHDFDFKVDNYLTILKLLLRIANCKIDSVNSFSSSTSNSKKYIILTLIATNKIVSLGTQRLSRKL